MSGEVPFDPVTTAELTNHVVHEVLARLTALECHDLPGPLAEASSKEQAAGNERVARALQLLAKVASFHPHFGAIGNPFGPQWRDREQRSPMATDLSVEELQALAGAVRHLPQTELRARVADVLWEGKVQPRHEFAALAVRAYVESAENRETGDMWPPFVERLERALQLSAKLKYGGPLHAEVRGLVHAKVTAHAGDEPVELLCHRLIGHLIHHDPDGVAHYESLTADLAGRCEQRPEHHFAYEYWRLTAHLRARKKDEAGAKQASLQAAEMLIRRAEAGREKFGASYTAHWLGQAVARMRHAKADPATIEELRQNMAVLRRESLSEMKTTEIRGSDIPGFEDAAELQVQSVQAHFRGLAKADALLRFGLFLMPLVRAEVQSAVEEAAASSPFASLFSASALGPEGNPVQNAPGLAFAADAAREQALLAEMCQHLRVLAWPLRVQLFVRPARAQILDEHALQLEDFDWFVGGNPWVPPGRERLFARGLLAGFEGDWVVATHILIPQLEQALRQKAKGAGIVTTTLEADGTEMERDLGWLLTHEQAPTWLGDDMAFNLRALLIEKFGQNLRNMVAHGLAEEALMASEPPIYLWWLTIHLLTQAWAQA